MTRITHTTITIVISVLALAGSVVSLVRSCRQDAKLEELSYNMAGIENRPRIKLATPKTFQFQGRLEFPATVERFLEREKPSSAIKVAVAAKVKAYNDSPFMARVVAQGHTDVPSGSPVIRNRLRDENERKEAILHLDEDYYHTEEILGYADHEFTFSLPFELADLKNKECVAHYAVLYTNEIGNLFDSYLWMKFRIGEGKIDPTVA